MNVLLLHLDGKLPNLALMRIAAHHRGLGDSVELRRTGNRSSLEPRLDDPGISGRAPWDKVYGSLIFKDTRGLAERAMTIYPQIDLGGTGWDLKHSLADVGIEEGPIDYQDYSKFNASIGFSQRGCRLNCHFCVVPEKEGKPRHGQTIAEIWRGRGPDIIGQIPKYLRRGKIPQALGWRHDGGWIATEHPREILLLDNDFFGGPHWIDRHAELTSGGFKVDLTQGINARMLNTETAQALAQLDYRASNMRDKRIYTAWDQIGHERPLMKGLEALAKAGIKPDHIMVYMLIGDRDNAADREHRRKQLRAFGARPYPMPYVRTPELVGFQRWVIGAYDKRVPWEKWAAAKYSPRKLGDRFSLPLFQEVA